MPQATVQNTTWIRMKKCNLQSAPFNVAIILKSGQVTETAVQWWSCKLCKRSLWQQLKKLHPSFLPWSAPSGTAGSVQWTGALVITHSHGLTYAHQKMRPKSWGYEPQSCLILCSMSPLELRQKHIQLSWWPTHSAGTQNTKQNVKWTVWTPFVKILTQDQI